MNEPKTMPCDIFALKPLRETATPLSSIRRLVCTILLFSSCLQSRFALAEQNNNTAAAKYAVQVSAKVSEQPDKIELRWPPQECLAYVLYRRFAGEKRWLPTPFAVLRGSEEGYSDLKVKKGVLYEYRIDRIAEKYIGRGYIYSGMSIPLLEKRGVVLLLVESGVAEKLALELERLYLDMQGDGWSVLRREVNRNETVVNVKKMIMEADQEVDGHLTTLFLLGHIPVPYSGNLNPDGHGDHRGAWPADLYYADLQGNWTDTKLHSFYPKNNQENIPGDGKFDQSVIPAESLKLQVGRVDLADMPAFQIGEIELLRRYLDKDHFFRHGMQPAKPSGFIDDNFGAFNGEAFAGSAWANFSTFFGAQNCLADDWFSELTKNCYLWAYGCGPGSNSSAGGVGTTGNFFSKNPMAHFTMLFGSYFGDWDRPDNLLRAPLASQYGLTSVWDGRPHWYFHAMAMGQNIGYCALRTQSNNTFCDYLGYDDVRATESGKNDDAEWEGNPVHVALMGDPTLRMHPLPPPINLRGQVQERGGLKLTWESGDTSLVAPRFLLYSANSLQGDFQSLTPQPLTGNEYLDTSWKNSQRFYLLKAISLQQSASGSYENTSQGRYLSVSAKGEVADAPIVAASHSTTQEDIPVFIPVSLVTSSTQNKVLYSVISPPQCGMVLYDREKGGFLYRPKANYYGKDQFLVVARDGLRESAPAPFSVEISSVEDQPLALSKEIYLTGAKSQQINFEAFDADGDQLSFRLLSPPSQGKLSGSLPKMMYSVTDGFPLETQSIVFVVNDGKSDSEAGKISLIPPYRCIRTESSIHIDGSLDDWGELPMRCTKPEMIKNLDKGQWEGVDDCEFRIGVVYDDHFLYIAVKVSDNQIISQKGLDPWLQDGVEIRIDARPLDLRNSNKAKVELKDYLLYALSPSKSPTEKWIYEKSLESLPVESKYVCVESPGGYIAELAIPLSYLEKMGGENWDGFRLNIAVDDKDSKGHNQIWWKPDWRSAPNDNSSGAFVR